MSRAPDWTSENARDREPEGQVGQRVASLVQDSREAGGGAWAG